MKKLLILSLLVAVPAIAMQNVPTSHTPGLYINPVVSKFQGDDAPTGAAVLHIVHDDKPQIVDYPGLPGSFRENPASAFATDSNGRNVIWWAALMGKKNLYNELVRLGANPDIKSTGGLLAGFSAADLIKMSPGEIESAIEAANTTKEKL